MLHHW